MKSATKPENTQRRTCSRPTGGADGNPPALVGLIRNPLSHRGKASLPDGVSFSGATSCPDAPSFSGEDAGRGILLRVPETRAELREVLRELADCRIDYLAVEGGDGTLRDVLTCGADIFGDDWPALILLPRGKTNALAVDIGLPADWSLEKALYAARHGGHVIRAPIRLTVQDAVQAGGTPLDGLGISGGSNACIQGFFLGAGAFRLATDEGQAVHRMSLFDSLAVGVIALWSMAQIVLGGAANRWRRNTPMRLRFWPGRKDFPHSEPQTRDERFLLVATTYDRFPLGARPFGRAARPGLKFGIIDRPRRWLMMMLPLIAFGLYPQGLARFGAHRLHADAADMEIADNFIVDGESFPAGRYILAEGPPLRFVVP